MNSRRLLLDVEPWMLFRALARKHQPFLVDAGKPWGNEWFSSMGFGPRMQLRIGAGDSTADSPLALLDHALSEIAPPERERARTRPVPFAGGAVLGLAYETKNAIERLPQTQVEEHGTPRLVCAIYDAVVVYDHRRRVYLVASWHLDERSLGRYAEEVLDLAAEAGLGAGREGESPLNPERSPSLPPSLALASNFDADGYAASVDRIRAYITAGDVYQVNLSLRLRTPLPCSALDLYGHLRAEQPVPFGGYFDLGSERLLSNSPELFLRRRGGAVTTCPIKGTRRRGTTESEDRRLAVELIADPKERAEHVMIVDLERNDLGRVCRTGSIRVPRLAELASFRTVHHLVSTVTGDLPPTVTCGELLRATFPGGSITGAPKIRAMEIIDEVERGTRGFYTGALGWVDASGDLDLNVTIRTAIVTRDSLSYHAGSGIVADSRPECEYAESLLKAEVFLRSLGLRSPPLAANVPEAAHGGALA